MAFSEYITLTRIRPRLGKLLAALVVIAWGNCAYADTIRVTFTGKINFTFDSSFGGPNFYGIGLGNPFSAVLTYDPSQPNLGTGPNSPGEYFDYHYTVTVQTSAGPVTLGGGNQGYPVTVDTHFTQDSNVVHTVNNAGSGVAFIFEDYSDTALSSNSLADVNWQKLLNLSRQPQPFVRAPNGAIVAGGSVHDMFLRASNAAVVVVGSIDAVNVQDIPSPPVANFTCTVSGLTVQCTDRSTGSPTSWSWNFGDGGTGTAQNPAHTYATAGTYSVSLTATNAGGSNTATKQITVGNVPVANFAWTPSLPTANQAVQFTDTSTGSPTSWLWNFGDGGTSTAQNPTHTYTAAGSYTVSLAAANAVGSNSVTKSITVSTAAQITVTSLTLSPSSVVGGQSSVATVTLSGAAGSGGTVVNLSSNSAIVVVPGSVVIPAGSTSATFTATTAAVSTITAVAITATLGSSSTSVTLSVTPSSSASTGLTFNIANLGATVLTTSGTSGTANVGYAAVQSDPGSTTPFGVAIFGLRETGVLGFGGTGLLVAETGVPATTWIQTGRLYAEVNGPVDTGVAVANPGAQDAVINFLFTDTNGQTFRSGSTTVRAGQHIATFLDQSPFNGGAAIQGTFTFSSSVPVAVIALRTFVNERGDLLITTLPVVDLSAAATSSNVILPHFADGGGWTTSVILVNPTDNPIIGTVQFRSPSGLPQTLTAGGQSKNTFGYAISPRSSFKLTTAGSAAAPSSGSVSVIPGSNTAAPVALALFSYKPSSVTVSQAGVPSVSGSALRVYVEASGLFGAAGSIQTAVAIANLSATPATVSMELHNLDGTPAAVTASLMVSGSGQVASLLSDLFPNLQQPFQGVLRISTASSGLAAVALRTRYNERGDFLITTTPPVTEGAAPSSAPLFFPQVVDGGGYTTEFVLLGWPGGSSGSVRLFGQFPGATSGGSAAPVANFAWIPSSPTVNQPVQFTDISTASPTSWLWDFGDGTAASTLQNPTHTYFRAGTYTISLTVNNTAGSNTSTKSIAVSVLVTPFGPIQ